MSLRRPVFSGERQIDDEASRRAEILARLVLQALPGLEAGPLSGLRLNRATPASRLSRLVGDAAPYWAHPWAGGLALAQHLAGHSQTVAGRNVLDLGTGGGLVALAAAMVGAKTVTGVDIDPWAISAARLNAEANGVAATFTVADATVDALPPANVIVVGDLFYEGDLAERMLDVLARFASEGKTVLIGDPGRATLPTDRLRRIASYAVADFGDRSGTVEGGVYRL